MGGMGEMNGELVKGLGVRNGECCEGGSEGRCVVGGECDVVEIVSVSGEGVW